MPELLLSYYGDDLTGSTDVMEALSSHGVPTVLFLSEPDAAFLARLRGAADTLSINERQRIVRLVVKDVLIGEDTITIRHSIPVQQGTPQAGCTPPSQTGNSNYLLCKGRDLTAVGERVSALCIRPVG